MGTPVLSCDLLVSLSQISVDVDVCAAATGAPAGFSLQWITAEQLANGPDGVADTPDDNTWPASDSTDLCKSSHSGNASGSTYNLGPNQCTTVNLGDNLFDDAGASSNCASTPLVCGTEYAIRGFAHANSTLQRSDFTDNLFCSTASCGGTGDGCTLSQGHWKTHGPIPTGNNVNEWPVNSLTLGTVVYTDLELQSIFDKQPAGNGLISLAHQLIAAKLNIANGADDTDAVDAIAAADALIGDLEVPPVGAGFLAPAVTSAINNTLTAFNGGTIGPGHCGPATTIPE